MGRQLRTDVPQIKTQMIPKWPYLNFFRQQEHRYKEQQEAQYNKRHRTQPLPPIPNDEHVWVKTEAHKNLGKVISTAETPKSYIVETDSGTVRRNRQHLTVIPKRTVNTPVEQESTFSGSRSSPIMTRSKTGTAIVPPERLC